MHSQVGTPVTVSVLGFGRSGTSLTANLLEVLGVDLGPAEDMLAPQETDNARGYWEAAWIVDLNDRLLERLGTTWWKPFHASPGWEDAPELEDLRLEALEAFARKLGRSFLRGWKDPRTTLTLPFWRGLAPVHPLRYVVCLRNPVEAIASVQRRPEPTLSVAEWGELWLEYTARALDQTKDAERIVVFYEDFFEGGGRAQIARLASFLGVPMDDGDERWPAASALVQGGLRHHRASLRGLAHDPGVPATARAAYAMLRMAAELRAAGHPDAEELENAAQRIVPDLWWAARQNATRTAGTDVEEAVREREAEVLREQLERTRESLVAAERAYGASAALAEDARERLAVAEHRASATLVAAERVASDRLAAERDRTRRVELDLSRAREALASVQGSPSWRLTAPLRAAKRVVLARGRSRAR